MGKHACEGRLHFGGFLDPVGFPRERFGQLHEIRIVGKLGVRIALVVEQLLPLAHHAEGAVVHDHDLHVCTMYGGRCHFLAVHLERTVARYANDRLVGASQSSADGGREAESHGAQAAGGKERPRQFAIDELCSPHLMLANFGDDDGVGRVKCARKLHEGDFGHDRAGGSLFGGQVEHGEAHPPLLYILEPFLCIRMCVLRLQLCKQGLQHVRQVAHDGNLRFANFSDFGGVDVDVNDFRIGGERIGLARHAVREPCTARYDQV